MDIPRQRRPALSLDMTPLIDCVFQLLIFFMLSSSFLTPALQLELPQASAGTAEPPPEQIFVSITTKGEVYLNQEQLAWDALESRLAAAVTSSRDKIVTVRGDKEMQFDFFVRAFSAAQAAGATRVDVAHTPTP
jgi:biopolymer transport protein ExbD